MSMSTPQPYRCPTCKSSSVNPRNLVVFIDGTSNKPGDKDTNVMKLFKQVKLVREGSEPEQRRCYLEGIGAYEVDHLPPLDRLGKAIYSSFEMALAWNAEKNVKVAYSWLVEKYQEGNEIHLFGFSRGAYQVRTLASMIHEVGLVTEKHQIDSAYDHYLSIDPYNVRTRQKAVMFKREFCWPGVRIHFVGVWDTVSSLGLIKRDVHITASASVTNACHFRHALALDERRVKFMPEYFAEVNAYRSNIGSRKPTVNDVKEVWFAGSHSDVGGVTRRHTDVDLGPVGDDLYSVHAGNVPLLWMKREAAANGLVFKPEEFVWDPVDVDFGRKGTMTLPWKFLEILPIRHQVSFNGTGKHERRWHRFCPRSVIPRQLIHSSVLSGDVYTPRATLGSSIDIPTVPRKASGGLWTAELPDEEATMRLLTSLLSDQGKTLESLEKVLFLLSRLDSRQIQTIGRPNWSIPKETGFDKFALSVIYDVISTVSEEQVGDARNSLRIILSSPACPPGAFYVLRFSTRHERLRRHFIAHDEVIKALMLAVKWTAKSPIKSLFPLVIDSLRFLINDSDAHLRDKVINRLGSSPDGTKTRKAKLFRPVNRLSPKPNVEIETRQTMLSVALEVKAPSKLIASLKMIASVAQHQPGLCKQLKPKILKLVEMGRSPVGSAALEVLVAMKVPLSPDTHFPNILGYLCNTLPRLDAEVGSTQSAEDTPPRLGAEVGNTQSPNNTDTLPPVLRTNGSEELDGKVMHKLVLTIKSHDAHERTAATLTLLKLCTNSTIREFCSRDDVNVVHIFMSQLERKETSLLAAYALRRCLEQDMVKETDFKLTAQRIVTMLDKGWFDDAVGRVEGFEILGQLMTSGPDALTNAFSSPNIVAALVKKLGDGDRHEVRQSLKCFDILGSGIQTELTKPVGQSIDNLTARDKRIQKKAVKILSALAQTPAGEQAIKPHVKAIVNKLLPSPGSPPLLRSQLFGPIAVLYDLSKNDTLRAEIQASQDFSTLKKHRRVSTLLPHT